MNCPRCGKELIEQDGIFLCENCSARFRKKQVQPTNEISSTNTVKRSEETVLPQETGNTTSQKTEEQLRIEYLEQRIAELEARQLNEQATPDIPLKEKLRHAFSAIPPFVRKHKKPVILAAIATVLIFAVMIPLLVSFCGVRGVYVNEDDPNSYYVFTASSCMETIRVDTTDIMTKVDWHISKGVISFSSKSSLLGDVASFYEFEKLDGNRLISIGGTPYRRVAFSSSKKCTVRFYNKDGSVSETMRIKIGSKIKAPIAPAWIPTPYHTFVGWCDEDGHVLSNQDRVWEDKNYIATWK